MMDTYFNIFVNKGIPVLGIEPAGNVAKVATEKGIPTRISFFGENSAQSLLRGRDASGFADWQ